METKDLSYPCYIVCYGPERDYRTTYRGEHGGYFSSQMVFSKEDADIFINSAEHTYAGHRNEMTIEAVFINNFGELESTVL